MLQVLLLPNGDLHPTGQFYKGFAEMERAAKAKPERFEPGEKYMLITPSKVMPVKHEQATVVLVSTTVEDFPGAAPRKPRKPKVPASTM